MGRVVPPDGPAPRPRHVTQLVKRAVPGLVARRAGRAEARIKFKCLYFFARFGVFIQKNVFNITTFELNNMISL
jgi:hypothetical protein